VCAPPAELLLCLAPAHAERARGACHDPNTWPPRASRCPIRNLRGRGRNPRGPSRSSGRTKRTDRRDGQGTGRVIVSPTSAGQGTFDAQVKVNIHNAAPNTTFTVTRAVDSPADGSCTSTDFVTVATLTTSAGGAGAVEFERSGGPTTSFDLFLRVIGDDGTILESGCMVITPK
jgi:hypothetical protein